MIQLKLQHIHTMNQAIKDSSVPSNYESWLIFWKARECNKQHLLGAELPMWQSGFLHPKKIKTFHICHPKLSDPENENARKLDLRIETTDF